MRNIKTWMKVCSLGPPHAMIWPIYLSIPSKRQITDLVKWLHVMCRSKRNMALRVPILSKYYVIKFLRQPIYGRHNLIPIRHRKPAAWTEVVLDINHQQNVTILFYFHRFSSM